MSLHRVLFLPSGKSGLIEEGVSLRTAARSLGEGIETLCGERATCGKCKVRVLEGMTHLSPPGDNEKSSAERYGLRHDERLACQALVQGEVAVLVPEESRVGQQTVRKDVGVRAITVIPTIRKYYVELSVPTLEDPAADWERLRDALDRCFELRNLSIDHSTLRTFSSTLRQGRWQVTVTVWDQQEIIRVEPGLVERAYGLAVDVGSTTVAGYLCDLISGEVVAAEGIMNPQVEFGEDIIARIYYTQRPGGYAALNSAIISGLSELARRVTRKAGLLPEDILEVVLVGNTVMHHILLGLDVAQLGSAPFTPSILSSVNVKARDLGLAILPSANIHLLPIEAGYVGADNVAVLIAEEPYNHDDVRLIIDIGTNGELILGNSKHLLSTSCATGPAFEGASLKFGMRAAPGAIEKVRIDTQTLEVSFRVIGSLNWNTQRPAAEVQARGICGSGIVDALAEMLTAGIIDKRGHFNKGLATSRLRSGADGKPEYVLAWREETSIDQDITVTTEDVVAIQLGKAAMYAGAQVLLERYGVEKPDKVILAGGFGSVIDRQRALTIGLFPDCSLNNVYSVGNAAGDGARMALLNKQKRSEAERVARQIEYVELTLEPSFTEAFVAATRFNGATKK